MSRSIALVALWVAIVALAAALRGPHLERRPAHVDEAVHTWKFNELWTTGRYVYDPVEYHGPTLYYLTFPAVWLGGGDNYALTTLVTYRLVPLVAGLGLILLLPLLCDGLGRGGASVAAALTAVSPAFVYYSRYYIQEMLLVLFTLLLLAAGWRYVQSRRVGWALLGGAALGLMHATKETCIITIGALLAALLITVAWQRPVKLHRWLRPWPLVNASLVAIVVSVTLYSGLFTNAMGPIDSIRTYATYFERAGDHGVHTHPWHYYFDVLLWSRHGRAIWTEAPVFALGLIGMAVALRRPAPQRVHVGLLRFLTLYTLFLTLAYTLIPYKTPWCALSFLHGWILLAGVGAIGLVRAVPHWALRTVVALVLLAGGVHLAAQARQSTSLRFCADSHNPYVYAQTLHHVNRLTDYLAQLRAATDRPPVVKVIVPNAWPLPWYLRSFDYVGYWEAVPDDPDADIIIVSENLAQQLEGALHTAYAPPYSYSLRRDETVVVYVTADLRAAFERAATANARTTP